MVGITSSELSSVLREFNPWWLGRAAPGVSNWRRAAAVQIDRWADDVETKRALVVGGARQVGKTMLFRQAIQRLLEEGAAPESILYVTYDHPVFRLAGVGAPIAAWEEMHPGMPEGRQWLFLDEVQAASKDWGVWLKHQVDFHPHRRIAVTGSAISLRDAGAESGVGRWIDIPLPTLSFGEYLGIRGVERPLAAPSGGLRALAEWTPAALATASEVSRSLTGHFHEYLLRSGFPEASTTHDIGEAQRRIREDIVDKVLKRDMTALFGVRGVDDLERVFLYLARTDGGLVNISKLSNELDVKQPTVNSYFEKLEAARLIYRLKRFGYGQTVKRAQEKIYMADPALSGAIWLRGDNLLANASQLGRAVETAFFKHAFTRFYRGAPMFTYWRDPKSRKELEVDLIAETAERTIPFEVKHQDAPTDLRRLAGLIVFMDREDVDIGYVVTRRPDAIGRLSTPSGRSIIQAPAPLACLWLS